MKLAKKICLLVVIIGTAFFSFCIYVIYGAAPNWIDIGSGAPKIFSDIPYRYMDVRDHGKVISKTHVDLISLVLNLQSGRARNSWVYLPVTKCYAPDVRDGYPSVLCDAEPGGEVLVVANEKIREILLKAKSKNETPVLTGIAVDIWAGNTPVIMIMDKSK